MSGKLWIKESSFFYSEEYWRSGVTNTNTYGLDSRVMILFEDKNIWIREWKFRGVFGPDFKVGKNIDSKYFDFCYYSKFFMVGIFVTEVSINLILIDLEKEPKTQSLPYSKKLQIVSPELCYLIPKQSIEKVLELKIKLKESENKR